MTADKPADPLLNSIYPRLSLMYPRVASKENKDVRI